MVVHLVVSFPASALLPASAEQPFSPAVRVSVSVPEAAALVTVTPSLVVQPVSVALIAVLVVPAVSSAGYPGTRHCGVRSVHLGCGGAGTGTDGRHDAQWHGGGCGYEKQFTDHGVSPFARLSTDLVVGRMAPPTCCARIGGRAHRNLAAQRSPLGTPIGSN